MVGDKRHYYDAPSGQKKVRIRILCFSDSYVDRIPSSADRRFLFDK